MKYTLTDPCDECPFLKDSGFKKSQLLRYSSGEFACHKTCKVNEGNGDFEARKHSPHCAGALIFLEKRDRPHQMMRICERLGFYDRRKLNMKANVV